MFWPFKKRSYLYHLEKLKDALDHYKDGMPKRADMLQHNAQSKYYFIQIKLKENGDG